MKTFLLTLLLAIMAPVVYADELIPADRLQESAEQGNTDAQMEFGSYYELGYGRPKDLVKALAWYMLAGAHGHYLAAKRAVMLESRLTPGEVEAARKLSEQLTSQKQRAP